MSDMISDDLQLLIHHVVCFEFAPLLRQGDDLMVRQVSFDMNELCCSACSVSPCTPATRTPWTT